MKLALLTTIIFVLCPLLIKADACSAACGVSTGGSTCAQGEACCENRCRNACGRPGGYCTLFGSCQCN